MSAGWAGSRECRAALTRVTPVLLAVTVLVAGIVASPVAVWARGPDAGTPPRAGAGPGSPSAAVNRALALAAAARQLTRSPGSPGMKSVSYRGYMFRVPRSWPVIRNRSSKSSCVRFDQHAVYLGTVSADQFCPSWLLGTTESMLIQPGPAAAPKTATENPVSRQVSAEAPGIVITATFDSDPGLIRKILVSADLPAPKITRPVPAWRAAATGSAGSGTASARSAAGSGSGSGSGSGEAQAADATRLVTVRRSMIKPPLPAAVASYHGLGFDACAAPSASYMRAWRRHSPYRAIGIYIGGADRACAQANLTQSWVRGESAAGWRFIPLYAGPQAAFGEISHPVNQGKSAAEDAAVQAARLGFGPRTPIYYDMEAYLPGVRVKALRFLSAWTTELHKLGYESGVYSSSDSGVVDLARNYHGHRYAMPDIIYDALWNGSANVRDRNISGNEWPHHRRIHQFSGNVTRTFGGATINIDEDYLDVRVSQPLGTAQATSAVTVSGGAIDVIYRGSGKWLWFDRYSAKKGWSAPTRLGMRGYSVPSVVWTGSSVDVFYKARYGRLWEETFRADGRLTGRYWLKGMGILGWGPRTVVQAGGVIDVFWRGSADNHLWHAQYTPGHGWHGPQNLGGDLASLPTPAVSSAGVTTVFWKGTDKSLWYVHRDLRGVWSRPASLGMQPMGGAPRTTGQSDGGVEVYWKGTGSSRLWEAFYQPGRGWRGPRDLGGSVRSVPWPMPAVGTVQVMWRGPDHRLHQVSHINGKGWNDAGWKGPVTAPLGWAASGIFSAVRGPGKKVLIFWMGSGRTLWSVSLTPKGWGRPVKLAAGVTAP